jgi:hypothetical protein
MNQSHALDRHVRALRITECEAAAVLSVRDLLDVVVPPRASLSQGDQAPLVKDAGELETLFRAIRHDLAGQKVTNAHGPLRDYVQREWTGTGEVPSLGILPPVSLIFLGAPLGWSQGDVLLIPRGRRALVLDGASRIEAMRLATDDPATPEELRGRLYAKLVGVQVIHGLDPGRAEKYFLDVNGRGVGIKPSLLTVRDESDPYARVAESVFAGELEGDPGAAQARDALLSLQTARIVVGAIRHGVEVVRYGGQDIPQDDVDFSKLEAIARQWMTQVFSTFGKPAFRDRGNVLGSVPVLVSLAALGRGFYEGDDEARATAQSILADRRIDWSAGTHWDGVCGDVSPTTGTFSLGTGDSHADRTYRALTNENDPGGRSIRRLSERNRVWMAV